MKHTMWLVRVAALLLGCSGLAAAQCAGISGFGFDLLQTVNGTQDNSPGGGLGSVTFSGTPLPGGVAGTADTIVCRKVALQNPIQPQGQKLPIQIVALLLEGTAMYNGQMSSVYAVINQTQNSQGVYQISTSELPVPPSTITLEPSTGFMTVFPNGTFNTTALKVQALIIVVPLGEPVTYTPRRGTFAMNADSISATGSIWTTTEPPGYPSSTTFPSGGFYVTQFGSGGAAVPLITSRVVTDSLYALGLILVGIAILKIRSGISGGRLNLRPVYLLGMAAIAWFLGWRSTKLTFPKIVHAAACMPVTMSVMVNEGGSFVVHKTVTAVCSTTTTTTTASVNLQ